MSTEEAIEGVEQVGHSNAMNTESWRKDAIRRIETGTVLLPPELVIPVNFNKSRRHSGWVTVIVGVILLGLFVLLMVLS